MNLAPGEWETWTQAKAKLARVERLLPATPSWAAFHSRHPAGGSRSPHWRGGATVAVAGVVVLLGAVLVRLGGTSGAGPEGPPSPVVATAASTPDANGPVPTYSLTTAAAETGPLPTFPLASINCHDIDTRSCLRALELVRQLQPDLFGPNVRAVVDATCPSRCSQGFSVFVVLVPPMGAGAPVQAFLVYGLEGPQLVRAYDSPLPSFVLEVLPT